MANIKIDLDKICRFRKRANAEFLVEPDRYTILDTSPYLSNQYTKFDLDMRRKTEILKYKGNASSSLGNNLTRAQLFSLYSSGRYQRETLTYDLTETIREEYDPYLDISFVVKDVVRVPSRADTTNCGTINTPSSSSDVPGPVINLYNDPSVPLYNYNKNTAAYGNNYLNQTDKWRLNVEENIIMNNNTDNTSHSLYLTERIDTNLLKYEYKVPISLFLSGKRTEATRTNVNFADLQIELVNIGSYSPSVKFDTDTIAISPDISYTSGDNNVSKVMKFNVTPNDIDISGSIFIGVLHVKNVELSTESGFIYDFTANFKVNTIFDNTGDFESLYDLTYGVIFNTLNDSTTQNGMTISSIPETASYEPFYFSDMV